MQNPGREAGVCLLQSGNGGDGWKRLEQSGNSRSKRGFLAADTFHDGAKNYFVVELFHVEWMPRFFGQQGKERQLRSPISFTERVNGIQHRKE